MALKTANMLISPNFLIPLIHLSESVLHIQQPTLQAPFAHWDRQCYCPIHILSETTVFCEFGQIPKYKHQAVC